MALSAGSAEHTDYISADFPNVFPGYGIKQSDGETSIILELWGKQSNPSSPSLPDLRWLGVLVLDWFLCMSQIEVNSVIMLN